jgi:hypothetical protein
VSDPPSAAASVEATCPEVFPATSFDAPGVDLGAGSRTGVVLVVTAIVIILQDLALQAAFSDQI